MADQIIEQEEWRPIEGQPWYEVSNLGRVRSLERTIIRSNGWPKRINARILRPGHTKIKKATYLHLVLSGKKDVFVHTLVCAAFHGPRPSLKHEVAHWDGDGTNCRADNLRWATHAENHEDKIRHGRHMRGRRHHNAKLTEDQVREIRAKLRDGQSPEEIAEDYPVTAWSIREIEAGRNWAWLD